MELAPGKNSRLSQYAGQEEGNASRYFKNPLGGLKQYYIGTFDSLGLMVSQRFGVGLANMHLRWRVRDGGSSLKKLAIFKGTQGAKRRAQSVNTQMLVVKREAHRISHSA